MHSAKSEPNHSNPDHPNPIDRNKSIIWSRYLIDSTDWLVFASTVTRLNVATTSLISSPVKLLSLSVLSPGGKVLFEGVLKPQEEIASQLIEDHGLEQSIVFNAMSYSEMSIQLGRLFDGRQVLAWDLNAQQALLDEMATQFAQPQTILTGYSLRPELARFVGEPTSPGGASAGSGSHNYKPQPLTVLGKGSTAECRALVATLSQMAGASQSNSAATGNQSWTGEFYRPKVSATDKIKDFLGL
ncbi:hypothetical protein BH11CYA1_BH11CYA1_32640 [soil metagenome]